MTRSYDYIMYSTKIPNIFFDYWMKKLNNSAYKIVMAIGHQTYGWHKPIVSISIKQLEKITGLGRSTIIHNLNELVQLGLVLKIKSISDQGDPATNEYKLCLECSGYERNQDVQDSSRSPEPRLAVVSKLEGGSNV
jgi:hypothetical protein